MESSHPTKLMDWLFEPFSEGEKAEVLHLGNPVSQLGYLPDYWLFPPMGKKDIQRFASKIK